MKSGEYRIDKQLGKVLKKKSSSSSSSIELRDRANQIIRNTNWDEKSERRAKSSSTSSYHERE